MRLAAERVVLLPAVAVSDEIQKGLMDACVVAQFRMKGGRHGLSLPHGDGIMAFGRDHFDSRAHALDFWRADEDHLQRRVAQLACADRAVDLPSIGIPANADIERAESGLIRISDFFREHDGAGTRTKGRLHSHKFFELGDSLLAEDLEKST